MFAQQAAEQFQHGRDGGVEFQRLRLHRTPAGKQQQLLGQLGRAPGRGLQIRELRPEGRGQLRVELEQLQVERHRREDVVEIVRHTAGELADDFHLLRLPHLFLQGAARRDVGEAGHQHRHRALRIAQGLDVDGDPNEDAVGAADAHDDVPHRPPGAQCDCGGEFVERERAAVFADFPPAEFFGHSPDQVVFGQPENPRGRGVGLDDPEIPVHHDDPVGHGAEDQAQLLLALAPRLVGLLLRGDVAVHAHEPLGPAFGIALQKPVGLDHPLRAVGSPEDAKLEIRHRTAGEEGGEPRLHQRARIRMQARAPGLGRSVKRLAGVAVEGIRALVPDEAPRIGAELPHAVARTLHREGEALVEVFDAEFGAAALGDVLHKGAVQFFAAKIQPVVADDDVDPGSVLAPQSAVEGDTVLRRQVLPVLRPALLQKLRVEVRHPQPHHLLAAVAQQSAGGGVGIRDRGVAPHPENRDRGMVHREARALQRLLRLPSRAHIARHREQGDHLAGAVAQRGRVCLQPAHRAFQAPDGEDERTGFARQRPAGQAGEAFAVIFAHEIQDAERPRLLDAPGLEHRQPGPVHLHERAVAPDHFHALQLVFENRLQEIPLFAQLGLRPPQRLDHDRRHEADQRDKPEGKLHLGVAFVRGRQIRQQPAPPVDREPAHQQRRHQAHQRHPARAEPHRRPHHKRHHRVAQRHRVERLRLDRADHRRDQRHHEQRGLRAAPRPAAAKLPRHPSPPRQDQRRDQDHPEQIATIPREPDRRVTPFSARPQDNPGAHRTRGRHPDDPAAPDQAHQLAHRRQRRPHRHPPAYQPGTRHRRDGVARDQHGPILPRTRRHRRIVEKISRTHRRDHRPPRPSRCDQKDAEDHSARQPETGFHAGLLRQQMRQHRAAKIRHDPASHPPAEGPLGLDRRARRRRMEMGSGQGRGQ